MKRVLLGIVACFWVFNLIGQHSFKGVGTWYAFDVRDPSRSMEIVVAPHHQDEDAIRMSRKVNVEAESITNLKRSKKVRESTVYKSEVHVPRHLNAVQHILSGEFTCKVESDNLDDSKKMDAFSYEKELKFPQKFTFFGKNTEIEAIHGFIYRIDEQFYKEVIFLREGHFKNEDKELIESVFVIGKDKDATRRKAVALNYDEEVAKFYKPDPNSGRKKNPIVLAEDYSTNLKLNKITASLEFPYVTTVFYMPSKTIEGRNINYKWGAFSASFLKNGEIIKKVELVKSHFNGKWMENVKNEFIAHDGDVGRLSPGKYQIAYQIYNNDPFFVTDVSVYGIKTPSVNEEAEHHFLLGGSWDNYMRFNDLKVNDDKDQPIAFLIRKTNLMNESGGELDARNISAQLFRNGELYGTSYTNSSVCLDGSGYNLIKRNEEDIYTLFQLTRTSPGQSNPWLTQEHLSSVNGEYRVDYLINGKIYAEASFWVKDEEIVFEDNSNLDKTRINRSLVYIPLKYKY